MNISVEQYAGALFSGLREVSEKDHDTVIENLVRILKQNNDLDKFDAIVEAYERIEQKNSGIAEAVVTTATPHSADKKMMDALNNIAGSKVKVTEEVDESIIGGVIVRIDDTLLDASIKTKLDNLKDSLSN
jgi:F-type H+-transporting ATPase subunit delta